MNPEQRRLVCRTVALATIGESVAVDFNRRRSGSQR